MHTLPLRLPPGADLRREIEQAVVGLPEQCGFVLSGIGSLAQANLRFAAAESSTLFVEPLEVLSLAGSVTPEGAHLHASVSTASGNVLGGHVSYGCIVRTTAEVLIAVLPEWSLSREHDAVSGYKELKVARRSSVSMSSFATSSLPTEPTVVAPDGSDVRVLLGLASGGMAHFELRAGATSRAVTHRTVEEVWFVVSGHGEMWRRQGEREEIVPLKPGVCLTIPLGTHFQFRASNAGAIAAVGVTMPPWPGEEEAVPVAGVWQASRP